MSTAQPAPVLPPTPQPRIKPPAVGFSVVPTIKLKKRGAIVRQLVGGVKVLEIDGDLFELVDRSGRSVFVAEDGSFKVLWCFEALLV
jgi:hypothetical protein